jgi:hypothetical protein
LLMSLSPLIPYSFESCLPLKLLKLIRNQVSILERLLGIGTLHLDSAGTNGTVDIVFNNLINPVYMRHRLQHLIDQYVKR